MRDDLPSGTVTFLFTDVEGSTRLLHELGAEGYAEALADAPAARSAETLALIGLGLDDASFDAAWRRVREAQSRRGGRARTRQGGAVATRLNLAPL